MHLPVAQRSHHQVNLFAKLWRSEIERLLELRLQSGARLLDRYSRLEAREGQHKCSGTRFALCGFVQLLRADDVDVLKSRKFELLRQHPDDTRRLAINRDHPADNRRIAAVMTAPEVVGDQHDTGPVGMVLVSGEVAPQHRADAERREESRFDAGAVEALRIALSQIAWAGASRGSKRLERDLVIAPIVIPAAKHELLRRNRRSQSNRDQARWIGVRQRAKKDAIDDAEYRRGCADADHQRENRGDGEHRAAAEPAQAVAYVVPRGFQQ